MFYSQHVLTKKGPLAKIWLAAHMQSKLTKAMVFSTDLRKAVESIISPEVPMALRLTSNLLLGVVRILHRKSKYLLQESSEAMTRLKIAFRSGVTTDLPPRTATTANYSAITLQPSVDTLNAPNLDLDLLPARATPTHTSFLAADRDITIDEFAGGLVGGMLDAFALEPEFDRQDELDSQLAEPLLFTPSQRLSQGTLHTPSIRSDFSHRSELSVEAMRADSASLGGQGQTPVLSTGGRETPADHSQSARFPPPGPSSPHPMPEDDPETARQADTARQGLAPSSLDLVETTPKELDAAGDTLQQVLPDVPMDLETPEAPAPVPETPPSGQPPAGGTVIAEDEPSRIPRISTGTNDLELDETPASVPEDIQATSAEEAATLHEPSAPIPLIGSTGGASQDDGVINSPPLDQMTMTPADTGGGDGGEEQDDELTPRPRRESREWQPPSTPETPETPSSPATPVRGRKRKAHVFTDEGATELSASTFRACLNDTSDLIRGPRAPTRRRVDAYVRYTDMLTRPAITLAPALRTLFEQTFRAEELVVSPMSDADLVSSEVPEGEEIGEPIHAEDVEEREKDQQKEEQPSENVQVAEAKIVLDAIPEAPEVFDVPELPEMSVVADEVIELPNPAEIEQTSEADQEHMGSGLQSMEVVEAPVLEGPALLEAAKDVPVPIPGTNRDVVQEVSAYISGSGSLSGPGSIGTSQNIAAGDGAELFEHETPELAGGTDIGGSFIEDSDKISLKEVSMTRAQVDPRDKDDVTEATISSRTRRMREYIAEHSMDNELNFSERLHGESEVSRRIASRAFYELLNLSSKKAVSLRQSNAYGDIFVKAVQPAFNQLAAVDDE